MKEENGNEGKVTETKDNKRRNRDENALVTRESLGAVGALFSALAFLILMTRSLIFGDIGVAVDSFLLGVFGYAAYVIVPVVFVASVAAFIDKTFVKKKRLLVSLFISAYLLLLIVHGAQTASWENEGYFSACFTAAEEGVSACVPAGWLGGLVVGTLFSLSGRVGAFVILAFALAAAVACVLRFAAGFSVFSFFRAKVKKRGKSATEKESDRSAERQQNVAGQNSPLQETPFIRNDYIQGGYPPNAGRGARYDENAAQYGEKNYSAPNYGEYAAAKAENYERGVSFEGGYGRNDYDGGYAAQNRGGAYPSHFNAPYEKYNEYGFPTDNVRQRPGVTLSKDSYPRGEFGANVGDVGAKGFSPFGNSSGADTDSAQGGDSARPISGRELLYGGDPIESFRNNLIFDPESKFNQRKSAANEPIFTQKKVAPAAPVSTERGGFGASYTQSYEEAINGGSAEKFSEDRAFSARRSDFSGYRDSAAPYNATTRENALNSFDFTSGEDGAFGEKNVREFGATDRENAYRNDFSVRESGQSGRGGRNGSFRDDSEELFRGEFDENISDGVSSGRVSDEFSDRESVRGTDFSVGGRSSEYDIFGGRNEYPAAGGDLSDDAANTGNTSSRSEFSDRSTRDDDAFLSRGDRGERSNLEIFDDDAYPLDDEPTSRDGAARFTSREGENVRGNDDIADRSRNFSAPRETGERESAFSMRRGQDRAPTPAPEKKEPPKPKIMRPYRCAPLDYFDCTDTIPDANSSEIDENKQVILDTLDAFKVPDATIASVTCGPTVTRYNVAVPRYISPKKVVALDQPVAMNLHAANGVNIAPNFEDGTISVEVPNRRRQTVTLGSMLVADEYINAKPNALIFAMGKNVGNKKVYGDIRKMTHILVAGTSGSGKTAFLHSLIISLIMKYSPADLRLILIDPKKTEFVVYEGLPHLVINEVLSDTNKVIQSLNWAIAEMERRYDLFNKKSRSGTYVVNIDEYNANLAEGEEKLPKIVIIADEVAAMMQDAKKDMEDRIQNLTQKSRATGIHMILATQRPSTDVITGVIKSNLKSRIALSVASEIDSRVILDESGAQNLLGQGDLLYSTEGTKTPIRMQAPFISSEKAQEVVRCIKENNDCCFDEEAAAFIDKPKNVSGGVDGEAEEDVEYVYVEALRHVILSGSASISLVQRKCSVGYNKAGKIIEWMEDQGYISAFDGAKARKVLITPEQFEEKFGPL